MRYGGEEKKIFYEEMILAPSQTQRRRSSVRSLTPFYKSFQSQTHNAWYKAVSWKHFVPKRIKCISTKKSYNEEFVWNERIDRAQRKKCFPGVFFHVICLLCYFSFWRQKKIFFLSPAFSFNFFFFAFFLCFPCVNFLFYSCYVLFAGFNSFSIYSIRTFNASLIKNFPLRFISLFFIFLFS